MAEQQLKMQSRAEQLAAIRDTAMQKFEEGMQLIAEASTMAGVCLFSSEIMKPNAFGLPQSLPGSIETGRKALDRVTWNKLFSETGLDRCWNHKQREAFSLSLRTDPPIASISVIRATLRAAAANRPQTLADGFVSLLTELDRGFIRNRQKNTMPSRFVLRGVFQHTDPLTYNGYNPDNLVYIRDFENIVCICTGVSTPANGADMAGRLTALRTQETAGTLVNSHGWRCKLFQNGNVHIHIDSPSLLNALNDLISLYFAGQLPAGEIA